MTVSWQRRNFTCLASDQSNVLWLYLFVLLQALIISAAFAGVFPAPLSNPVTQRSCSRPRGLGRLPRSKRSDRQQDSHISAPRSKTGTGAVVAWAFLWQSHQLMQSSPHLTLSSFGICVVLQWVTSRGLTQLIAKLSKKTSVLVETAHWPTLL